MQTIFVLATALAVASGFHAAAPVGRATLAATSPHDVSQVVMRTEQKAKGGLFGRSATASGRVVPTKMATAQKGGGLFSKFGKKEPEKKAVAKRGGKNNKDDDEEDESKKLLQQIKDAGVAGIISYIFWEWAFWGVSIPVCISGYYGVTGHWPDFSSQEDLAQLGAEAFAFVNVARFAVPLRIGLALSTTPWVQSNLVDKFQKKD